MIYRSALVVIFCTILVGAESCGYLAPSRHRTKDYSPVDADVYACDLAKVRAVVDREPRLLVKRGRDNATLLHEAVNSDCNALTTYLLEKGAAVNAVMDDQITALHLAAQRGNIAIAEVLLRHGADINAMDAKGWTPLDRAITRKRRNMAAFLRKHGGHGGTLGR